MSLENIADLAPNLLSLRGKQYSLEEYKVMRPLFKVKQIPWKILYKCGRQVGKTQSVAAQSVIQTSLLPNFLTLFVLPLAEMSRRVSSNYVKPLIEDSPIKSLLTGSGQTNAVLQKSFKNGSIMFFSYAFLDCTRIRGISSDRIVIDEVQDMQWDFLPIIRECMSASRWGIELYTGTPKTMENTIELLWDDSSQAEWVIKCKHCNFYNVAAMNFHLGRMLGPVENIKTHGTGLICYKCGRPIHGLDGCWVHRYRDRIAEFSGYHVPQPIMPLHYTSARKWRILLQKRDKMKTAEFMNEVVGESCDVGTKLVTLNEVKNICVLPWKNNLDECRRLPLLRRYTQIILGADWGGGGAKETSYTTVAVIGLTPTNRLEVIYGERMHSSTGDVEEVQRIIQLFDIFQCQFLAHDFCGAGSVHETLLIQAGMPMRQILPIAYAYSPTKNIIYYHSADAGGSRGYYIMDKGRSLAVLCALVKTSTILMPAWQSVKSLAEDFTHLIEDKIERPGKSDVFRIIRMPDTADDFVHACNYAAWGHFRTTGVYPDMAHDFRLTFD